MKGLNLGCGPIYLDSTVYTTWENSDFADTEPANGWKIDKKRDFLEKMEDLGDNSVDFIVAWHIFEHIPMHLTGDVIREWKRVLKPGGQLYLACPDITEIARHIISRDGPWSDWFICMVNIFGPYNGFIGDIHRWGYDQSEIQKKFIAEGFSQAGRLDPALLARNIGEENAKKLGFADYNVQAILIK